MIIKEYLEELGIINNEIIKLEIQIQQLRALSTKTNANLSECNVIHTDTQHDKICIIVEKIVDLENNKNNKVVRFASLFVEINDKIFELEKEEEINVLIERYINFLSFENIAKKLNYSSSYIFTIHKNALEKLQKIVNE